MTRISLPLLVALAAFGCASPRAASNDARRVAAHDTAGAGTHDAATHAAAGAAAHDPAMHAMAGAAAHDAATHAAHMAGRTTTRPSDSSFAAVQSRGAVGMGVDQYTSTHTFEPRPDGGRITLQRNLDDSAGVAQIRSHLAAIAAAFAAGDFTTPAFVHAGTVPGTDVMAAKRGSIRYQVAQLPRGAELIITTGDAAAIEAIHRFLAFQRMDHRAGDGTNPPPALPR